MDMIHLDLKAGSKKAGNCFPSLGFEMPSELPPNSEFSSWWCDPTTEYAFLGFSYEVTDCECLLLDLFFWRAEQNIPFKVRANRNSSASSKTSAIISNRGMFGYTVLVTGMDSSKHLDKNLVCGVDLKF